MRRFFILFALCLTSVLSRAQAPTEICNNGIDDDFDGFIDCYDGSCANNSVCDGFLGNDAACEAVPPAFPEFSMALDFASPNETTNHLSRMAIGDLNRDGVPEIVTMNRYTRKLFILNGSDGKVQRETTVTWEPYWEIAIANLDNDNCGEIFFIGQHDPPGPNNTGVYIFAYDCQLNKLWETAQRLRGDPINFGIADFDGDGQEELYAKDEVYDAKTGTRIIASTGPVYNRINGGPVAANIVGDDKLELIVGLKIYQVNLGTRAANSGSLTLLQDRSEYFVRNEYNATSIADYNLDGYLDVLASGSTGNSGANTTVFFWDVKNNTIKTFSDPQPALGGNYTNGWVNGTGRLNIADLDGNGLMNASYVSGRFLYALDENFNLLWRVSINEETSGHTGCTLFDFNGDGKAEIVYRDERFIYIIEGSDGSVYSQQACISRTNREYPIVADLDADGSTELCVACGYNDVRAAANFNNLDSSRYSHIRVFKSAAEPWVPARRVWNQHGYFVVNVNDDLTIPTKLQPHQLVFSTGNCTQGPNRPLNKFLNQSPYLNSEGCPTYAAPDIAFEVAPTIIPPTCPSLDFQVSFKITNRGDVAVTGNIPVSFYSSDPMQPGAAKLATINIPVSALSSGDIVSVDNQVVTGNGSPFVYVVLNDAGTSLPSPIVLPNTSFIECDYDNIRFAAINPLPVAITGVVVSPSESCTGPNNGVARAFIPTAFGENTVDYNFYWSNGTTAKPIATTDYVGAVYSGLPPGTYTVYARHKTANCNSDTTQVVIGSVTAPFPPATINILSHQTSCSPFNGKLEVVIQGGGAGYTMDWFGIALNDLGISGPIASNLKADSYVAVIRRGTCNTSVSATINPPAVPDAQASTVQDVMDCQNPNSGSVTADALVSGIVQNPNNYTFTWYEYDQSNNARGSVLAAIHGTGNTRTGLPVGFYQVEVRENASQCPSTVLPIVEVESDLDIPDAPKIVILSSQTSCDPLQPNGVMTANVTVGGVPQNPANFTFEWFKGQTTQAISKVTTVSDINGKTVNQVAGGGIPYTVRVTNAFNCSALADSAITENIIVPVVSLAQLSPNTICDPTKASTPNNGSLQATVTFNGSNVPLPDNNYSFEWRNPANAVIAVADNKNPILSGQPDGSSYSVTVRRTDLNCASAPDTEPILPAKVLPQLQTTSTGSNTCVGAAMPDGTATVTITNSIPADAFVYRWHSGNAVVAANVLLPTNNFNQATAIRLGGVAGSPNPYTVLVTNTRTGCENTATQFVSDESVIPVISFVNVTPNTICNPLVAPFNGTLTAQVSNPIGPITNYNFDWFNGNSNASPAISGVDGAVLSNRQQGFYTVEVENTVTKCRSTAITNQVPDGRVFPAIAFDPEGSRTCDVSKTPDGQIEANVTNGGATFTYAWSSVAPAPALTAANNPTAKTLIRVGGPTFGNPARSYQVVVTNSATGCQGSNVGQVPDLSVKPTLTLDADPNTVCATGGGGPATFNGKVEVTAVNHPDLGTGAVLYQWFNADPVTGVPGAAIPGATSAVLSNRGSGKYGVQVTINDLGCSSEIEVDEIANLVALPNIDAIATPNLNCPTGSIVNNGSAFVNSVDGNALPGTYTFQWYNGAAVVPGQIKPGATSPTLGNNLAENQTFTVQVRNLANGCLNNETVTVTDGRVTPTASLSVVRHNQNCTGTPNGELLATATNAGANFSFTWGPGAVSTSGANGANAIQLATGNYTVFVTNNDTGCFSPVDSETILNNFVYPDVTLTVQPQSSCVGQNGSVTANDPGGRTFTWYTGTAANPSFLLAADPGETNVIDDLATNDYTVEVVIAATGCKTTQGTFVPTLIVPPTIALVNTKPVEICGPLPSAATPDGAASVTLGAISSLPTPNFTVFYVRTQVINGVGAGTFPTDPAVIKASAETYSGGANPPSLTNLSPGYLSALVVDNNTGCESTPRTVAIADNTSDYDIDVVGIASAGQCNTATPNGAINVDVLKNGVACTTCTYEWYDGTPLNSNINFFNNPPNMGASAIITTNQDLGNPNPVGGVSTGDYTLIVKDTQNGCGAFEVENVPSLNPAPVTITPTQPTECVNAANPTNNGSILVQVDEFPGQAEGYTVNIFAGNSPTGAPLTSEIANTAATFTVPLNNLNSGDYFVQVIDHFAPNTPCPQGFPVTLLSRAFNPSVIINQINPNTSCDPLNFSDGSIQLTAMKDPADQSTDQDYRVTQITPQPRVAIALPALVGASGNSGESITLTTFQPQTVQPSYVIRVQDNLSFCFKDVTVVVPDAKDMPSTLAVTPTPETNCSNLAQNNSNGSALAQLADPLDTENLFDFTWAKNSDLTAPVFSAAGNNALTGGELLNQGKTVGLANWPMGADGLGSGDRTYFVQAVKNTGSGRACKTGVVQVVIPDAHVTPNIAITTITDSFCNANALNGVIGDGQIQIVADANPSTIGQEIPGTGFEYEWSPVPAGSAITPIQTSLATTYSINQLGDGNYTLRVRNGDNECRINGAATVAPAPFVINLFNLNVVDQRICNNDGEIEITGVNIVNQSANAVVQSNAGATIDALYTFRWYNTAAMTAGAELEDAGNIDITGRTLSIDLDNDFLTEAGDYPNMQAGTYYVVGRRSAGASFAADCPTLPLSVVVNDVHRNPVVQLAPLSNTSCVAGTGDGEISITVTDATNSIFGPFAYDYNWTAGGLGASNANNGNGTNDGDNDREISLLEGTYTLNVSNPASGCSSVSTVEVRKNSSPIFIQGVLPTDELRCDPVNGDGSLTVTSVTLTDRSNVSQSLPVGDFTFDWRRQGNAFTQASSGPALNNVTYNKAGFGDVIGAGTYFVTARRTGPAASLGINCVSAPFTAVIQDKRINPVVSLTPFANTACDPLFSEGSIEVRVADGTLVPGPHTFSYDWDVIGAADPTAIGTTNNNNGDGLANGDADVAQGLFHGNYDVRVTNNQSGCSSVATTTIFRNSTPIIIPLATTTPQIFCSADGSIQVSSVEVTDRNNNTFAAPFADFDFTWTAAAGTPSLVTDGALGAVPGGTIIDRTVFSTIQRGQYLVTATRVNGNLGRGCVSAPYHATIEDKRIFPELNFSQDANSSCNDQNPNGTLIATAKGGLGADTYAFSWAMTPGPISPASVQTNNAANKTSTLTNALHGNYLVTATNNRTSCPVTSPVTLVLDQSLSTPNIIEVQAFDPVTCNPTGQAAVTRITLGSTTNSILFPPKTPPDNEVSGADLNNYEYEWYQGSVTPGSQLPIGGPFVTSPTITSLLTGTYFVVVRDPSTNCRSGAREVIITPDDIVFPDLLVSQTALQISCRPGIGSAELTVTADGQSDSNPNYTFTWFANGSATAPSIATGSTLSDIVAGTYSVTVHDNTTNCSISDAYIVEDNTQDFTPIVSMASQPRTLCVGTDGEIFARVLNLSLLYPYPYNANTFTADLYVGATPNLNSTPDFPGIRNLAGFIGNFNKDSLNQGFYTVRITDNNTGCFGVGVEEVKDSRLYPAVVVQELAPVTNCDPSRPNGVAQVTANNTFVGFTFDWYEGTTASGTPVYTGAEYGELKVKPQQYVVRVTDNISGCFTDVVTDIENGTVPIPAATVEVLSHVTSCIENNGSLTAYVGEDRNTASYIFHWYDGTVENPPADNIGESYHDLALGFYSVTATSIITGCKSPLVTEEILNKREFPDFDFVIQNTTCDQNDGFASLILISNVPIERIEWSDTEGPFLTGPNFTDAAAGQYEVTATTFLGCQTSKVLEIKPDIRPYNGISRNGDGQNEFFKIDCIQNFPSNIVRIFNRAGTLVYEAENYDNTSTFFDGRSNRGISPMGVNLPDGTYYYIVDKRDGTKPIAGYLEIVK